MKVWEMAMLHDLERMAMKKEVVKEKWRKFAETGSCVFIVCDKCPLNGAACLSPTTLDDQYKVRRKELLNKEVEE